MALLGFTQPRHIVGKKFVIVCGHGDFPFNCLSHSTQERSQNRGIGS